MKSKHFIGVMTGLAILLLFVAIAEAAPMSTVSRTILPIDSTENIGTTTKVWDEGHFNEICLSADCQTAWPSGSAGSSNWTIVSGGLRTSTSTDFAQAYYFTATSTTNANTFSLASTTALTTTRGYVTQLANLTGNGFVKTGSGNGTLSIDTTTYESALTAGDGLTRTVNDFDCDTASGTVFGCLSSANWTTFNNKQDTITAGDALTLTGTDIDFDGGATPSGDLGNTWASPSVTDDSHAHTGSTLSGIDISADTNLTVDGTEIVLTDDALSLGTALTFTTGTSTTSFFSALGTFTNLVGTNNTFTYATTTNLHVSGRLDIASSSVSGYSFITFTFPATPTTTTATNTVFFGFAPNPQALESAKCKTSSATTSLVFTDTGTNDTNSRAATTTGGEFLFTSNNTYTAGEDRAVEIGALTAATLTCTAKLLNNP